MALYPIASFKVSVAKPFAMSHGDAMRGLRTSLDRKKVRPAEFKIATEARIRFEITFSTEHDALAFRRFEWRRYKEVRNPRRFPICVLSVPPSLARQPLRDQLRSRLIMATKGTHHAAPKSAPHPRRFRRS